MKIRTITIRKAPKTVALAQKLSNGTVIVRPMTLDKASKLVLDDKAKPVRIKSPTWEAGIRLGK
jgi:hypothetical protein